MGSNNTKQLEYQKEKIYNKDKNDVINKMIQRVQINLEKKSQHNKENTRPSNNAVNNQMESFRVPSMDSVFNNDNTNLQNKMTTLKQNQKNQQEYTYNKNQDNTQNQQQYQQQQISENFKPNPQMSSQQQQQKTLQNAQKNLRYRSYLDSHVSMAPIKISKNKGFRMDRNILAEILPTIKNKCVTITYTYKIFQTQSRIGVQPPQQQKYQCQFKFDVVQKKHRYIWVYKEECKHNFDDKKYAFVQPIQPVVSGDVLKFSLNFYNLNGLVDLSSIYFKSCKISDIPNVPLQLDPNEIGNYDKNRICEIEELYTDWTLYEYYHRQEKIKLDHFQPYLKLEEVRCSGVDIVTSKHLYKANKVGQVPKAFENFGVNINIVPSDKEIIAEVKKIGLFHDLENTVELRVGDFIIVYISKGD
ncbi:hypothetical protein PPERSA_03791 [Pseudocohnilembus persalinus]|uniref:Uncharacterized protein n=1 Tax=Pseudocohnilembus persalinus TaxID=266149 RepID=A0A0V0QUG8_PSEPJ|nr:hypothetical protein PPERSA_03791 [Pseudocohnilembus persalinus]|eukprot:KRX05854.1 hypothetical protein PPERSA_03791 [Pseudocohnilembus persalinus]